MDAFGKVLGDLFSHDDRAEKMSKAAAYNTKHLALSPDEWIARLLDTYSQVLDQSQLTKSTRVARANYDVSPKVEICA